MIISVVPSRAECRGILHRFGHLQQDSESQYDDRRRASVLAIRLSVSAPDRVGTRVSYHVSYCGRADGIATQAIRAESRILSSFRLVPISHIFAIVRNRKRFLQHIIFAGADGRLADRHTRSLSCRNLRKFVHPAEQRRNSRLPELFRR